MFRINNAFHELKSGTKITDAAFDTGYESLSGFGYTFKKLIGRSPQKSMEENIILLNRFTTPLGPMFVAGTDKGICLLEFTDRKMLETEFKDLQRLLKARIILGENTHIQQANKEMEEYFEGKRQTFDVALHTVGSDFQQTVWNMLKVIPYGTTVTYQQQSEKIQNQNAVRSLASTNGANRICIIIPCHRVIGKNGNLTGYSGGIERKRWLINHERAMSTTVNPGMLF
jgi:AraC family transcriptional regulator of adaptative response/methylated-DNA-[protein]-cysteine methyltransferase